MLNYENLNIIFQPLGMIINSKFILMIILLSAAAVISGVGVWVFFYYWQRRKKEMVLRAESLDYIERLKKLILPLIPGFPKIPKVPIPGLPDFPKLPDSPNLPDTPKLPDSPNLPDTPKLPDSPSLPGIPNMPDSPNPANPPSLPDIPFDLDALNNDLKPFGFAYYPPQDYFYSIMYGWQSECGYCMLYDEGSAGFSMIIDCEPVYFKYGGKKWLIEFWKGQYGMTSGCEIGIYTTTGPILNIPGVFNGTFYECAGKEDHLPLAFSLKKNGKELFHRRELHWWLTGFRLGEFSWPHELTVDIELTLKDKEMLEAFVGGMLKTGYSMSDLSISGTTVSFVYATPHSEQPRTRTSYIENYMQTNNNRNCTAYNMATSTYNNTVSKLKYVRYAAPKLYHRIINIGGTKEIFKSYELIRKYLELKEPIRNIDKKNGIFLHELPIEFNEITESVPDPIVSEQDIPYIEPDFLTPDEDMPEDAFKLQNEVNKV